MLLKMGGDGDLQALGVDLIEHHPKVSGFQAPRAALASLIA
jgi:hypothetical protein